MSYHTESYSRGGHARGHGNGGRGRGRGRGSSGHGRGRGGQSSSSSATSTSTMLPSMTLCKWAMTAVGCTRGDSCKFSHTIVDREKENDQVDDTDGDGDDDGDHAMQDVKTGCKYFAAGYCLFGKTCGSSHDVKLLDQLESQWLLESKTQFVQPSTTHVKQKLDFVVILDFEGRVEVIEVPVLILDLKSLTEKGRFHRWNRPEKLFEEQEKGGKGERNAATKSTPFATTLGNLHEFLGQHGLLTNKNWCFVTCGDWDLGKP